jgi:hypothetical protein
MKLRWDKWLYGVGSGFVGGGAAAVVSSVTAAMLAPDQFGPAKQLVNFITMAGTTFVANGLLSALFYLKQSPLPEPATGNTEVFQKGQTGE